jgi:hypothetical protein
VGLASGYHYLSCDGGCDDVTNWSAVQLTMFTPIPDPTLPPRQAFAVSPKGAAAFAMWDNFGMHVWYCKDNCSALASWGSANIGPAHTFPERIAFSPDERVQLVSHYLVGNDSTLQWWDCPSNCADSASWGGVDGLIRAPAGTVIDEAIATTAQGGTRIVAYYDDPTTPQVDRFFSLLTCDSQCRTPANWSPQATLPIPTQSGSIGFDVALTPGGQPVVAFASDTTSGFAACSDCNGPLGHWTLFPGLSAAYLNAYDAVPPPASCTSTSWFLVKGPALAIDLQGDVLTGVIAEAKAFGGQCGSGTLGFGLESFLVGQ